MSASSRRSASRPQADAAVAAAETLGYPVALKIVSPEIVHKSDAGGVVLDLDDAQALRDAAGAMLARVATGRPDATIEGFSLQSMVRRSHARELIVGASVDPVFGPVIVFGQGGVAVELLADRAIALPPLNRPLAQALVARTRVARLLGSYRDIPAADLEAVYGVLIAVSHLLAELPELAELDINPLSSASISTPGMLSARARLSSTR